MLQCQSLLFAFRSPIIISLLCLESRLKSWELSWSLDGGMLSEMIAMVPRLVWIVIPAAYSFMIEADMSKGLNRMFLLIARAVPPPRLVILSCLMMEYSSIWSAWVGFVNAD